MRYHDSDMAFRFQTPIHWMTAGSMAVLALFVFPVQSQQRLPTFQTFGVDQPVLSYISQEGPGNRPGDRALAGWALEAWAKASGGALSFRVVEEKAARLRVYWVSTQSD